MSVKTNIETINGKEYLRYENPIRAIREKCVEDCCAGSRYDADNCLCPSCPLYPFRFGKNPYRQSKNYTDEQLESMRERMSKMRSKQSE